MSLSSLLEIVGGAVLAVGVDQANITVFGRQGRPLRIAMALQLLAAAIIYAVFAHWSGSSVPFELIGMAIYGAVAAVGVATGDSRAIGIGWGLHVLWDLYAHQIVSLESPAPSWYPGVCIGYDLVMLVRGFAMHSCDEKQSGGRRAD